MVCLYGSGCNCINLCGTQPQQACSAERWWSGIQAPTCTEGRMAEISPQAVVLLSGGMDSTVSAAIAIERSGAKGVAALHAGYGQRTQARERRAFQDICEFYGIQRRLVIELDHLRTIGGSALTSDKIAVPEEQLGGTA